MTLYQLIIQKVALKNNLSESFVNKVWKAYWKCIKLYLQLSNFKLDYTELMFNTLVNSVNIPSLGKIYCTFDMYKAKKNHYNKYKKEELNASN